MSLAKEIANFLKKGYSVFLEASAGTGKTTALVNTVKYLLENTIFENGQKILLLTFTEKATLEMQQKLINLLTTENKQDLLQMVQIKTIDSFFLFVLRNYFIFLGAEAEEFVSNELIGEKILNRLLRKDWLLDEKKSEKLYRLCLSPFSRIFESLKELQQCFLGLDKIMVDLGEGIEDITDKTEFIPFDSVNFDLGVIQLKKDFFDLFNSWYKEKTNYYEHNSLYSFSSTLQKISELSLQNPKLVQEIKKNYTFVFIDEFQDTNKAQWAVFENLFIKNGIPLCTVGDPKQSIYEFRGADLGNYLMIRQSIKENKQNSKWIFRELLENYRSSEKLTTALNHFFEDPPENQFFLMGDFLNYSKVIAKAKLEEKYLNFIEEHIPFTLVNIPTAEELKASKRDYFVAMVHYTAKKIQELQKKYAFLYSDFVLLIEKRNFFEIIAPIFNEYKIPYFFYKQRGLLFSKAAKNLLLLLESLQSFEFQLNRLGFLTAFLGETLDNVISGNIDIEKQEFFYELAKLAYQRNWAAFFTRLRQSTLWYYIQAYSERDNFEHRESYKQILELAEEFAFKKNPHIGELIEYLIRLAQKADEDSLENIYRLENKDAVKIMTMHQSKGLEFPFVFCFFDLNKQRRYSFPVTIEEIKENKILKKILLLKNESFKEDIATKMDRQDRRLIYVALTRAKYGLWVFSSPLAQKKSKEEPKIYHTLQKYLEKCKDQLPKDYIKVESLEINSIEKIKNITSQTYELNFLKNMVALSLPNKEIWETEDVKSLQEEIYAKTFLINSYSSLSEKKHLEFFSAEEEDYGEETSYAEEEEKSLTLPGGKKTGSFLHEILEIVPFSFFKEKTFSQIWEELSQNPEHPINLLLFRVLRKYNFLQNGSLNLMKTKKENWYQIEKIRDILKETLTIIYNTLSAKLPSLGISLCELKNDQILREVGFLYLSKGQESPEIRANRDYLKGNIDLVFLYNEKLYFIDYKSNHVPQEQLQRVNHELYFLQQLIYESALSRLLENQRYKLGGWFYIYLRLTQPNKSSGIISKIY